MAESLFQGGSLSLISDHFLEPEKKEDDYFGNDCEDGLCWFEHIEKERYRSTAILLKKNRRLSKMKTIVLSVAVLMLLSCTGQGVRLSAPLNASMDEMMVLVKQAENSEVTIYLDPSMKAKQVTMGASGGICKYAKIDLLIGSGISGRMQEGFKALFPKAQFIMSDVKPIDSSVANIEVKSIDIGFEFSPISEGHGCNPTSKMNKGWVTLVIEVQTFDQKNRETFNRIFTYKERQMGYVEQLAHRDEILEVCLNKIIIRLMKDIRTNLKIDPPTYFAVRINEKALEKIPQAL